MDKDRDSCLIDHSLYFPFRLWEYYYHSGDGQLVERLWNNMLRLVEFMQSCLNGRGLLEELPYSVYYDWADTDRRGEMLVINALYAEVLKKMIDFSGKLNLPADTHKWSLTRENIQKRISEEFFDTSTGVFSDCIVQGGKSTHTGEHANSAAILFGCADKNQTASVIRIYREKPEIFGRGSPAWSFWLPALVEAGEPDLAIEWINSRFGKLLKEGFSTIPETWSLYGEKTTGAWRTRNSRAEVQSVGVWVASFLISYIAGITPYKPGFKEILLKPRPGSLKKVSATIPLGQGEIKIEIVNGRRSLELFFSMPVERRVLLSLPPIFGNTITLRGATVQKGSSGLFDLGIQKENLTGAKY